jgi:hypothetical protein
MSWSRGPRLAVTCFAFVALLSGCSTADPGQAQTPSAANPSTAPAGVVTIPSCDTVPCQGSLEPGTYRATFFEHPVEYRFTIPDPGWTWYYSGNFRIVTDETPTDGLQRYSEGIYVLLNPSAASHTCEEVPERGVGRSVDDLADWLVELPGLDVTGRAPASVGGLHGVQLDLALDAAWTKPCPFSEGLPAVPLVVRNSDFAGYHWTMVPELSMRWFLLPWKDGVILIDIDNSQGRMTRQDLIAAATPIVESFVFSEADAS